MEIITNTCMPVIVSSYKLTGYRVVELSEGHP